mgnify:CR=1 FL=1
MLLQRCQISSPVGELILLAQHTTLISLMWSDRIDETERHLRRHMGPWTTESVDEIRDWSRATNAYFNGVFTAFDGLSIRPPGTAFQALVWAGLRAIPPGNIRSYQELARFIGRPTSCRAVANANGKNPLPIVIPCHRVISTDGSLGGFSSGLPRKRWLLRHEGIARF